MFRCTNIVFISKKVIYETVGLPKYKFKHFIGSQALSAKDTEQWSWLDIYF